MARLLRDERLRQAPIGRRYIYAYEHLSAEVSELAKEHPQLRPLARQLLRVALQSYANGELELVEKVRLTTSGMAALRLLRRHGSPELNKALDNALESLPALLSFLKEQKSRP